MYPITEAVMALFEAEHRKVLRITGTDKNGAAITITDDNVLEDSFQIDRYSCNGEKLEVGTAISAQMSFTLENGDGTYDGIVFENTELFADVGVADWTQENPTVHWVPCGYFTPDMQPRRLSTISITALDRMAKFDVVVDATDLTFPTTIAGLVGQVCTVCGVTLAQSISTLTNADVTVAALPSANGGITTYRNLIQWCAGVMGTNAWFDWNGQLRFSWYDNATGYVSTMDNRYSSDLYEDDLTVTGVEYTNDSGIVIVEGTDDYAIDLTGNAIAGPLIATVLPPLNTALNGFTYRPFTASVVNAPYLWPMDVVTFTDKNGKNHTGALTNVAFELNGSTALESKGMTYAINKAARPKGFTREQAQLINQIAQNIEENIDESLTQQEIFNRLTDNGAAQGLVLYDGQLYINATYINAGELSVRRVNFSNYDPPYKVPNEYDPDSLLRGQTIQDGWIVNQNGYNSIGIISCDNAVPLRGKTLIFTLISRNHITEFGGSITYTDEQGVQWEETIPVKVAPAYGREDAEGNLDGATDNGEYEQYSDSYTVPDYADSFYIEVECSGVKSISVSEPYSGNFGLRYGNNIGLNYKGLQVGKFVVDRRGNATFNGAARFNGDVSSLLERVYPVGSIYMSVNSTDPGTLFGGTWQRLKDRFLLAAGDSYAAGATGGEASHTLTAAESGVPAHAHGLNSHKHSVGAHSHGLNSHKHSVGAHSHGLNSHTHGVGSYGMNDNGGHTHNGYYITIGDNGGTTKYPSTDYRTAPNNLSGSAVTQSAGTHKHTITGTSGAASGNTANSSAFDTGAASGNTANSAAFDTGAATGNTANNTAANASSAHNNMPPYLAVYMWKRTA